MTLKNKIIGVLVALVAILGGSTALNLGSVGVSDEYNATTTVGMGTGVRSLITNRPAVLGSIVIASSSPTAIRIWNATSTTDVASTTVVTIPGSAANGTYTYDAVFDRGLSVQLISGFNGSYNITTR